MKSLKFHFQKIKTNILLVCNLLLGQNNREPEYMTFSQVLRNSLSVEKTTPAFCETCKKFTPTNQYARVTELPQILSINCGLKNDKEMNFLKRQLNRNNPTNATNGSAVVEPVPTVPSSSTPIKPCRYGTNCSRVDCHFAHSDRKSPASNLAINNNATTANGNARSNIWFPHHFTMEIDDSNELKVHSANDVTEDAAVDEKSNDKTTDDLNVSDLTITEEDENAKPKKGDTTTEDEGATNESAEVNKKSYKLTAVVCQVLNGNQKNLIALIAVGNQYHKARIAEYDPAQGGQWYIFNDFRWVSEFLDFAKLPVILIFSWTFFSIAPVSDQEAVWFTLDWKVPCVLFYSSTEAITHNGKDNTIESLSTNPFIHVSYSNHLI